MPGINFAVSAICAAVAGIFAGLAVHDHSAFALAIAVSSGLFSLISAIDGAAEERR